MSDTKPRSRPSFQFYPDDWIRDLTEHPLDIGGAWILLCCHLHYGVEYGKASKTIAEWARILSENRAKTLQILSYLQAKMIAEVTPILPKTLSEINDTTLFSIESRRMVRDEKVRDQTSKRVFKHRHQEDSNGDVTQGSNGDVTDDVTQKKHRSSSSSSSSSSNNRENNVDSDRPDRRVRPEPDVDTIAHQITDRLREIAGDRENGKHENHAFYCVMARIKTDPEIRDALNATRDGHSLAREKGNRFNAFAYFGKVIQKG